MNEHQPQPNFVDVDHPDYARIVSILDAYLENPPAERTLENLTGDRLVATVIWWVKENNEAEPETVISHIFGDEVWNSREWI